MRKPAQTSVKYFTYYAVRDENPGRERVPAEPVPQGKGAERICNT